MEYIYQRKYIHLCGRSKFLEIFMRHLFLCLYAFLKSSSYSFDKKAQLSLPISLNLKSSLGQIVWMAKAQLGSEHGIQFYDPDQVNRARNDP